MGTASYVINVGNNINESTKYNIKADYDSMVNLILVKHLEELKSYAEIANDLKGIAKLNELINNLKKEIKFYPTKEITSNLHI